MASTGKLWTVKPLSASPVGARYPDGWWGAFAPEDGRVSDVPSYVSSDQGSCVAFVHKAGGSCVIDARRGVEVAALPEVVTANAPVGTCDRCGALAYVELVNGADVLAFCLHHHRDNADALTRQGYSLLRDARHLLTF